LKDELEAFRKALGKFFQTTYMDNQLKEFEKCFLDNALLIILKPIPLIMLEIGIAT
jgi:hypothetical protein